MKKKYMYKVRLWFAFFSPLVCVFVFFFAISICVLIIIQQKKCCRMLEMRGKEFNIPK